LRKLATILLLIIFCNSLFYYGYFSISLLKAKIDAELALAKTTVQGSDDILKVPVSLLQKDEKDEVWYNGNLYDVVERDTAFVFLMQDEQEQNVLTNYGAISVGGHELTAPKMAVTVIDTEHTPKFQLTLSQHDDKIKNCTAANTSPLSTAFPETPFPPPKLA